MIQCDNYELNGFSDKKPNKEGIWVSFHEEQDCFELWEVVKTTEKHGLLAISTESNYEMLISRMSNRMAWNLVAERI